MFEQILSFWRQYSSAEKKTIYKSLIWMALGVAFLGALVYPTYSESKRLRILAVDIADEEALLRNKLTVLKTTSQAYADYEKVLGITQERLPPEAEVLKLMNAVAELAEEQSLKVDKISYEPRGSRDKIESRSLQRLGVSDFTFVINGEGEYLAIREFLRKLDEGQREMSVDSLSLIKNEDNLLEYNLRGMGYWK